ncbi:MAG: class I tRNA ligase family protein, partial [Candidatus Woesearchaeota archaeon]
MADNTDAFTEIPKKYNSLEEEEKVLSFWKTNDVYKFVRNDQKKLYAIDTPPPTVSGNMHIGHSFSFSQQDFVARYKRLTGCNVFYPFGTDDNGLPTERLVEKKKGVKSTKMDRSDFVALCDATIKEIKDDFTSDWIRLGMSCDFNKSYSTIDKEVQTISQRSFIELFNKGLIYEKEAPMSWCPKCQTAIAQAEFESKDIKSTFNDIVFKSTEGDDLIIATTRPEFIPACVGIFAHPEDERYAHLKGKKAIVPLFNFEVPLYFDEAVEKDKGTGLMMVCTFGDKEDIEKWMRLNLDTRVILEKDGTLNDLAGKYKGMTCVEARAEILKDLDEAGHLKGQTEIVHAVNVHERDGVELEFLITKQWFVKVLEHKDMLLKEVDKITWHPDFMKKRMIHWIE